MGQENNISCELCSSTEIETLYKAVEGYFGVPNIHTYMICQNCGLVFIHPKPTSEYLTLIYEKNYHPPFDITKKNLRLKIKEKVYAYYLTASKAQNNSFLRVFYKIVRDYYIIPHTSGRRILDVGCGNGHFLNLFKQNGWETHGTEISKTSASYAEKLGNKIFTGELTDAHYPQQYFDVIVINHVLEHISDPKKLLDECYNIIKDDGTIVVAVPNFDCFDSKFLHNSWFSIHIPCHLYQFNKKTLKNYLNLSHFKVYKEQFDPLLKSIIHQYYPLYPYLKSLFVNSFMNEKHISRKNSVSIFLSLVRVFIIIFLYKPICLLFTKKQAEKFSSQVILYAKKESNYSEYSIRYQNRD